jgi:hypothetical protein
MAEGHSAPSRPTLEDCRNESAVLVRLLAVARAGRSRRSIGCAVGCLTGLSPDRLFVALAVLLREVFNKLGITSRNQLGRTPRDAARR